MTRVVNYRKEPFDVYIGRPSKWGNPFVIGRDGTREQVIARYEDYILNNDRLLLELYELVGKVMGCSCPPKKCHGDILVKLVKERFGDV